MHPSVRSQFPCPARARRPFWTFLLPALAILFSTPRAAAEAEAVVRSGGSDIVDSATINYNAVSLGASSTRSFTFHNLGTTTMIGIAFSINGAHAADYTVNAPSVVFLVPGDSLSFSVTFTPSQAFTRTAALNIANNDPNENPYNLNLTGIGTAPEISVTAGGVTVSDGGSLSFGNVRVGLSVPRQVSIRNTGNAPLTNLGLTVSGSAFSAPPLDITSLAAGASKTFAVTFTPQGTFQSTGLLRISSSDADENPFDISLSGSGVLPLLDVESPPGTPIFDGAETLTISGTAGVPVTRTLLLRNVSSSDLTGLALSIDGPDAAHFFAGPLPSATLAPGATLTFALTFTAPLPGDSVAALHIGMDQSPANPFDIALLGSGLTLSDTGDDDDDGTANMLEIATGNDPLTPGPAPGVLVKNGDNLEFTFTRRVASLNDTLLTVEWTDDPAGLWNTLDNSFAMLVSDNGVMQEIRYTLPAGSSGRRFVRIRSARIQ
jgi:hypothetical protein